MSAVGPAETIAQRVKQRQRKPLMSVMVGLIYIYFLYFQAIGNIRNMTL